MKISDQALLDALLLRLVGKVLSMDSKLNYSSITQVKIKSMGLGILLILFSSRVFAQTGSKTENTPPPATAIPISSAKNVEVVGEDGAKELEDSGSTNAKPPEYSIGDYVYNPDGRRDPFKAYSEGRVIVQTKTIDPETLEPLQKFDLAKLNVLAILWNVDQPKAIIRDPDGKLHTVLRGQKMGRNYGFIYEIREGQIVVIETVEIDGTQTKEAKILSIGDRNLN